jgi:hypothetical protein
VLGRHVGGRADQVAGLGELGRLDARDAEIGDLDGAFARHHDVGGLDVAMDHALRVRILQRGEDLQQDVADLVRLAAEILGLQVRGQRPAEHALHHEVDEVALLAEVVHRHDVLVLQAPGGTRLYPEALQDGVGLAFVQARLVDHLDRERALDHRVVGLVHDRHGAGAELRADVVLADAGR